MKSAMSAAMSPMQVLSGIGGLVVLADGLPLRPLPPSLFSSKCPSPLTQFQVFPTQVIAFLFPTCWVRQSHHASTSPSSTLWLARVCPPSIPPFLALGPTFSAAAVSQLCYRRHGCRGKRFRFVGVHHCQSILLAGLYCQHRRVLASIDVMKEHWFMRELYSWGGLTVGSPSAPAMDTTNRAILLIRSRFNEMKSMKRNQ